jgi:undecaprenyl-diphosphatase
MGFVEGLTEFIPVSSTDHLILLGHFLGFVGEKAASFEVAIQLGAILSIVALYHERFVALIPRKSSFSDEWKPALHGWSGILRIGAAIAPALVVGFLARREIQAHLFTPLTVTSALFVGGIAILIAERFVTVDGKDSLESLTLKQALGIGVFQVLALWPGTSRSAATIVGGMVLGLNRKAAAEFSFLVAVPIMFLATGYEFIKIGSQLSETDVSDFLWAFVFSFSVALITVKAFIQLVNRWTLVPFAWYRIAAAPVFYLLIRSGF